jgi:uncharacterized protein (DUF2141 family)
MTVILLLLGGLAAAAAPVSADDRATVVLTVEGLKSSEGKLQVGLYREEGFPSKGSEIVGSTVDAEAGDMTVRLGDIEPGEYAVAVFHDLDGDGELDRAWYGLPREPYGFSGGATRPDYDAAEIEVSGETRVTVTLRGGP